MIDGMGAGRIFVVGIGGQLTLRDLEVRGGYCNEGAAVLVTGVGSTKPGSSGKLLALNVLFYNNTANTVNTTESSVKLLPLNLFPCLRNLSRSVKWPACTSFSTAQPN